MSEPNRLLGAVPHVRLGALARGAGVAAACLSASSLGRSRVLFAAYAVGWPLDRPGLQIFVVVPDGEEPWKRATVPFATSVTSWSTVMLVATTAVRRTKVPPVVSALLLGSGVAALDSLLADLGERRKATAASAAGDPGPATATQDGAEGQDGVPTG